MNAHHRQKDWISGRYFNSRYVGNPFGHAEVSSTFVCWTVVRAVPNDANDDRLAADSVCQAGFETFTPNIRTRVGARWRTVPRSSPVTSSSASLTAGAPSNAA
jgi:hypothetical protein